MPTMSIIQSCFRFYLHEIEGRPKEEPGAGAAWIAGLWAKLKAGIRKSSAPSEGGS